MFLKKFTQTLAALLVALLLLIGCETSEAPRPTPAPLATSVPGAATAVPAQPENGAPIYPYPKP